MEWATDVSRPTVIYDACVLYSAPLRDLLMWLAKNGLIAARWSEQILEEWVAALLANRPDLQRERLQRTCSEMNRAIPDAIVSGYESLIDALTLPDPDDRHVVAAARVAAAEFILTWNLKDFPAESLPVGMQVISPDAFLSRLFDDNMELFVETMKEHRQMLKKPTKTAEEYFATLTSIGLVEFVRKAERFADEI